MFAHEPSGNVSASGTHVMAPTEYSVCVDMHDILPTADSITPHSEREKWN